MKKQEESKRVNWNVKNLILHGIHVFALVAALWAHPFIDTSPARTLP